MPTCSFPGCDRSAEEDRPAINLCRVHREINDADCSYTEAITAAEDLIPALIQLACQGMCNQYLEDALREMQRRAYDDAARYKLAYDLGLAEIDMER